MINLCEIIFTEVKCLNSGQNKKFRHAMKDKMNNEKCEKQATVLKNGEKYL